MEAARARRITVSIASAGASKRVTVSPAGGLTGHAPSSALGRDAPSGVWQMSAGHRLNPAPASRTMRIA